VGSGGSTAGDAAGGTADGAARGGGGTGVAMPSDSSEDSEERWENVEEMALAEEDPACCLAFPCPPRRSTNTAQTKPAVFLAGTVAPAQMFDGLERPAKLLDEAVDPCAERAGGEMSGGWTRLEMGGGWTRPEWLAERACAMTSASSAV